MKRRARPATESFHNKSWMKREETKIKHVSVVKTSDCSGASFAKVGVLCPLPRPPPSIPPSFSSVRPEGTLPAGDPFSLSLSPPFSPPTSSVKLRGVKLEPRPIQQVSRRTHTHTHTHTQKSSPFAKFSIIRVPPWFVPHHTSPPPPPPPPPLLPCSLLLPPFLLILSSVLSLSRLLIIFSYPPFIRPLLSFIPPDSPSPLHAHHHHHPPPLHATAAFISNH